MFDSAACFCMPSVGAPESQGLTMFDVQSAVEKPQAFRVTPLKYHASQSEKGQSYIYIYLYIYILYIYAHIFHDVSKLDKLSYVLLSFTSHVICSYNISYLSHGSRTTFHGETKNFTARGISRNEPHREVSPKIGLAVILRRHG